MASQGLLSLSQTLALVGDASRIGDYSSLGREPFLVADLRSINSINSKDAAALQAGLRRLSCPSIAVASSGAASALTAPFDVVLSEEANAPELNVDLDRLSERIARTPQAAMAFVQLLRMSEALPVHDALLAESLVYSTLQAGAEFAAWMSGYRAAGRARSSSAKSGTEAVLSQRSEATLRLTLNRPERHNAFSVTIRDELAAGLELALADATLTHLILDGAGPSFCSGGDLAEFGSSPDPATAHVVRSVRNVARLLADCQQRLVQRDPGGGVEVIVHGDCFGAGVELPAFASQVTAAAGTTFTLPELAMGLVPGAGGTVGLPRRIGRQRTALLGLSGSTLPLDTALLWGLVDRVAE